jgi:hypothetical protein
MSEENRFFSAFSGVLESIVTEAVIRATQALQDRCSDLESAVIALDNRGAELESVVSTLDEREHSGANFVLQRQIYELERQVRALEIDARESEPQDVRAEIRRMIDDGDFTITIDYV